VVREENFPDVERRWPFALATAGPSELHSLELSQERMRRIVSAGRRTRAAPFALFASATCDAAPTLRGGSDSGVALACPVLNRRNRVIRQTVGHFARLAVLRVSGRETPDELTHNMRERAARIERSGCAPSAAALESAEFFLSFESHDYAHAFEGCATRSDPAVRPEQLRPVEIFVRNYGASSPVRVDSPSAAIWWTRLQRRNLWRHSIPRLSVCPTNHTAGLAEATPQRRNGLDLRPASETSVVPRPSSFRLRPQWNIVPTLWR
jgi:hypothetical protein